MFSFMIINRAVFDDKDYRDNLTNNDIVAYILLGDRLKVSVKHGWKRNGIYFLYFRINDLAKKMNVSKPTAVKSLEDLEAVGLLAKDRPNDKSKPNFLYLPNFNFLNTRGKNILPRKESNTKNSYKNNIKASNNKFSNNKFSDETPHTRRDDFEAEKHPEKDTKVKAIQAIKRTHLTRVIENIKDASCNDPDAFDEYFTLFKNAKTSILRDIKNELGTHSKKYKQARKSMKFEANMSFFNSSDLGNYVYHILRKAYRHHAKRVPGAFCMKCFKGEFMDHVRIYWGLHKKLPKDAPKIPIFKI